MEYKKSIELIKKYVKDNPLKIVTSYDIIKLLEEAEQKAIEEIDKHLDREEAKAEHEAGRLNSCRYTGGR